MLRWWSVIAPLLYASGARNPGSRRWPGLDAGAGQASTLALTLTLTLTQLLAELRPYTPFVGLQIEYSLLERTVEGELVPMARELGLGVTPWSPLKSGILAGRHTRANAGKDSATKRTWVAGTIDEKTYDVIEELAKVAKELDSTPARVALSWVQARPGVSSTIIGARTIQQLDDNLEALDVRPSEQQTARLDALTTPQLDFPAPFLAMASSIQAGGTMINGESSVPSPFGVTTKGDFY